MDPLIRNHVEKVLGHIEVVGSPVRENHCDLYIVTNTTGARYAVKLVEPEALQQSDTPEEIARWLVEVGTEYGVRLREVGVSLPPFNRIDLVGDRHVVQIMNAIIGPNFRVQIAYRPEVLDSILEILHPWLALWGVDQPELMPSLGIDPDPSNFGFYEDNAVYFDHYPARYATTSGVRLVGFPQPESSGDVDFSVKRYYHPEGMLRRLHFWVGLVAQDAPRRIVGAAHRVYSEEVARRIASFYASLVVTQVRSWLETGQLFRVREIICDCGPTEVDDLRELAQVLLQPGGELQRAYELSHIDFRLSTEERVARLEELKDLLLSKLG